MTAVSLAAMPYMYIPSLPLAGQVSYHAAPVPTVGRNSLLTVSDSLFSFK